MSSSSNSEPPPPPRGYDPGWNDPPKFVYNPNEATPKVKLNLNKRVAFPLSKPLPATQSVVNSDFPPPNAPPTTTLIRPVVDDKPLPDAVEELSMDDLMKKATSAIDYLIKVGADNAVDEEICSRLDVHCRRDLEGKTLSTDVLKLLVQVHEALTDESDCKSQSALALQFQQLLMVNHVQQCSLWGPAIKRIICCTLPDDEGEKEELSKSTTTTSPEGEDAKNVSSTAAASSISVTYFQPPSVDAPFDSPISPGGQITANRAEPAPSTINSSADSQSSSLFQRLKSRIMHV